VSLYVGTYKIIGLQMSCQHVPAEAIVSPTAQVTTAAETGRRTLCSGGVGGTSENIT